MRHTATWARVGAVAVLAAMSAGPSGADGKSRQRDAGAPSLPPGVRAVSPAPVEEMSAALAAATEAATRENSWDDLIRTFVAEDRRTLGTTLKESRSRLNDRAEESREAWRKRYGAGFDVREAAGDLGHDVKASAATVTDPSAFVSAWPVSPGHLAGLAGQAIVPPGTQTEELRAAARNPGGQRVTRLGTGSTEDPGLKAGDTVGVLDLPAYDAADANGLNLVRVSLIREEGGWKIDVPNYRTESLIRDDLLGQLLELLRTRDDWPKDRAEATRMVVQRVMMAVYGVAPPGARG